MKVKENTRVKLNYSIKLDDGRTVEQNPAQQPLEFVVGRNEVIPVLEQGVIGMEPGDERSFTVEPEDAFGSRDPDAVRAVSRADLSDGGESLEEGLVFRIRDEEGNPLVVTVVSMDEDEVMLDLNHPLAGARLTFEVELLEAAEAPPS